MVDNVDKYLMVDNVDKCKMVDIVAKYNLYKMVDIVAKNNFTEGRAIPDIEPASRLNNLKIY